MGFWGFRHYIGIPLSVEDGTIQGKILAGDDLNVVVAVYEDIEGIETHLKEVNTLVTGQSRFKRAKMNYAKSKDQLIDYLSRSPHIVYLLGHGTDSKEHFPEFTVGPKDRTFMIKQVYFSDNKISWEQSHPLILLNGCHTGDVKPEQYFNFIEPMLGRYKASGVIGTEITIYPAMAIVFAHKFLEEFLGGEPAGRAVRDARLEVLKNYNPLGLVYNPFLSSGLTLEKK
jgi:hypothetical protein